MFWEMYQTRRISRAESKANRAQSEAERTRIYIDRLENKVAGLALACQSLWELMREHSSLTEADLERKMEEIDIRDGVKDGKITATVDECGQCGRKTSRRRTTCLYCGAATEGGEVFGRP